MAENTLALDTHTLCAFIKCRRSPMKKRKCGNNYNLSTTFNNTEMQYEQRAYNKLRVTKLRIHWWKLHYFSLYTHKTEQNIMQYKAYPRDEIKIILFCLLSQEHAEQRVTFFVEKPFRNGWTISAYSFFGVFVASASVAVVFCAVILLVFPVLILFKRII